MMRKSAQYPAGKAIAPMSFIPFMADLVTLVVRPNTVFFPNLMYRVYF